MLGFELMALLFEWELASISDLSMTLSGVPDTLAPNLGTNWSSINDLL